MNPLSPSVHVASVETRVALTLVYVCNRIISKDASKLGRPFIIKVNKSKILAS